MIIVIKWESYSRVLPNEKRMLNITLRWLWRSYVHTLQKSLRYRDLKRWKFDLFYGSFRLDLRYVELVENFSLISCFFRKGYYALISLVGSLGKLLLYTDKLLQLWEEGVCQELIGRKKWQRSRKCAFVLGQLYLLLTVQLTWLR